MVVGSGNAKMSMKLKEKGSNPNISCVNIVSPHVFLLARSNDTLWLHRAAWLNAELEACSLFDFLLCCHVYTSKPGKSKWMCLSRIQNCFKSVLQFDFLLTLLYLGNICIAFLGRREIVSLKESG